MGVECHLGYPCAKFRLPSTFGSRVIHYVRDRQTDGPTKATLHAPYPTGGGITRVVTLQRRLWQICKYFGIDTVEESIRHCMEKIINRYSGFSNHLWVT